MGQGKRVSVELDPALLKRELGNEFSWINHLEIVLGSPRYGVFERATMVRACTTMLNALWHGVLADRLRNQRISGLYLLALAREDSYKAILEYLPLVNRK